MHVVYEQVAETILTDVTFRVGPAEALALREAPAPAAPDELEPDELAPADADVPSRVPVISTW